MMRGEIIFITGAPGSGKTTVAQRLCDFLDRSVYISVDLLRMMIKSGFFSLKMLDEESRKQYLLARKNAVLLAKNCADEGFKVVIDDIIRQKELDEFKDELKGYRLRFIHLHPSLEETRRRNKKRGGDNKVSDSQVESVYKLLTRENTVENGWIVVDSTEFNEKETEEVIIERLDW